MISDEMRELLSTYVDGELRDADAVRVEEWAKRDPELRREVEAYRILRRQLKEWDAAEHGEPPSPQMRETALQRAQAYLAATREQSRGRMVRLLDHPVLAAAALLLAVGAGLLLANRGDTRAQRAATIGPSEPVAIADVAPMGNLGIREGALVSHERQGHPAPQGVAGPGAPRPPPHRDGW
jgi:anti-sigma factor RsiW